MAATKIQWTEQTWNPTTGCDRVSPGCDHCYALTLAKRLKAMGQAKYQADGDPRTSGPGFKLTTHPGTLTDPYRWSGSRLVFVNSMSDLFHKDVPIGFIRDVFQVIADTPQHTYQILTKRSPRLAKVAERLDWPENLWMGVSIESQRYAFRADHLRTVPAEVRFISAEPLIGPLDVDLTDIHWLIVGGESGTGARPLDLEWVTDLHTQCAATGTELFVKQLGSVWARENGFGNSHAGDPSEWPVTLRSRQMPQTRRRLRIDA